MTSLNTEERMRELSNAADFEMKRAKMLEENLQRDAAEYEKQLAEIAKCLASARRHLEELRALYDTP